VRDFSINSPRPSNIRPVAYVAMECLNCNGSGCVECIHIEYFCSSTFGSPTCVSTGSLMTGSPYSNQAHIPSDEESLFDWQTLHRAQTLPTATSHHDPSLSSSPTLQRANTDPLGHLPTTHYKPSNFEDYGVFYGVPGSQPVMSALSHVDPTLHSLRPGHHNMSEIGVSSIARPGPQPQYTRCTLSKLAPKFDGHSQSHISNGQLNQSICSTQKVTKLRCPGCRKYISNRGNLNRHIKHHCKHGERSPCSHPGCNSSFARPDLVTKHAKQAHKDATGDACGDKLDGQVAPHEHTCKADNVSGDYSPDT
jgi:hypothetical protein